VPCFSESSDPYASLHLQSRRSISPISSPPHRSSANDAGDDNADGDGADSAVAAGADSAEAAAAAAAAVQRPKYVRTGARCYVSPYFCLQSGGVFAL